MKSIQVDPAAKRAIAGPGVIWGELDRATQVFGLATPGGTDSEVGVAGLTLGGGNGWLMGLHGATSDNLVRDGLACRAGRVSPAARVHAKGGALAELDPNPRRRLPAPHWRVWRERGGWMLITMQQSHQLGEIEMRGPISHGGRD
jgi:FAD binding domain